MLKHASNTRMATLTSTTPFAKPHWYPDAEVISSNKSSSCPQGHVAMGFRLTISLGVMQVVLHANTSIF